MFGMARHYFLGTTLSLNKQTKITNNQKLKAKPQKLKIHEIFYSFYHFSKYRLSFGGLHYRLSQKEVIFYDSEKARSHIGQYRLYRHTSP
jgi:hypothetical protein